MICCRVHGPLARSLFIASVHIGMSKHTALTRLPPFRTSTQTGAAAAARFYSHECGGVGCCLGCCCSSASCSPSFRSPPAPSGVPSACSVSFGVLLDPRTPTRGLTCHPFLPPPLSAAATPAAIHRKRGGGGAAMASSSSPSAVRACVVQRPKEAVSISID